MKTWLSCSNGEQFWRAFSVSKFLVAKTLYSTSHSIQSSFCPFSFIGVIPRAFANVLHTKFCLRIYFEMAIIVTRWSRTVANEMAFLSWVTCCQVARWIPPDGGQWVIDSPWKNWKCKCLDFNQWWIGLVYIIRKCTSWYNLSSLWELWNNNYNNRTGWLNWALEEGNKKQRAINSQLKTKCES